MGDEASFETAVRIYAAVQLPGIGERSVQKALDAGADIHKSSELTGALIEVATRVADDAFSPSDYEHAIGVCWDQLELATNDGQRIITYLDNDYPSKLKDLPDPPMLLFCKGNISLLYDHAPSIAVVGSRKAGKHGLGVSRRFGERLAEGGMTVVSGLAIGCDTGAHEGCLEKEGETIAVLPSQLDRIVPEQNRGLADRIVSRHGLLVSELAPLAQVTRGAFVRRNRIQAALSDKVIIVETSKDGGTMRTVEFAQKLGRPIGAYAFPEKYREAGNDGNALLIEKGVAVPLRDMDSIRAFLDGGDAEGDVQLELNFEG